MKQELYKPRSFQSCLKTAFDTVCSNAKTFIVNTWLPAILNALVIATMITLKGDGITALVVKVVTVIAAVFTNAFFFAKTANILNSNGIGKNFKRFALINLIMFPCLIVTAFLFITFLSITGIDTLWNSMDTLPNSKFRPYNWIFAVLASVFFASLLPASYSCMDYIYGSAHSLRSIFGKPYIKGLKSWFFLFNVHVLTGSICLLLFIPIFALSFILALIIVANDSAMALGDTSGLPSFFNPIYFLAIAAAAFIASPVCIWAHITIYYAYGTITSRFNNTTPAKNEE